MFSRIPLCLLCPLAPTSLLHNMFVTQCYSSLDRYKVWVDLASASAHYAGYIPPKWRQYTPLLSHPLAGPQLSMESYDYWLDCAEAVPKDDWLKSSLERPTYQHQYVTLLYTCATRLFNFTLVPIDVSVLKSGHEM